MIFSFLKLKKLAKLNPNTSIEQVVNAINNIGFEVKNFQSFQKVEGIKYGHVVKTYINEYANNLNVCEVLFADQKRIIQTTATNVRENDFLIAFVPGSKLGNQIIKTKQLKQLKSEGMLSSLAELGFAKNLLNQNDKDGILIIEKVDLTNDPIIDLQLNDYLIDVDILTNRSDANAYLVMAREIIAFFHKEFKGLNFKEPTFSSKIQVINNQSEQLAFMETNLKNVLMTFEDKLFLLKNNIKSINPVVDISNLTLLMTGMPTHVYDQEKIGNILQADFSNKVFTMLGNKKIQLKSNLVIKDENKDISLAGVMGEENTLFGKNSSKAIFEMGIFSNKEIKKSTKKIKLDSLSSKQSSKKVSVGTLRLGFQFLQTKLDGFSNIVNLPKNTNNYVEFENQYLDRIAGTKISNLKKFLDVKKSLEILGFKFYDKKIHVPSYRHDLQNKQDIIEEIFRFYGLDNLIPLQPNLKSFKIKKFEDYQSKIIAKGFQKVCTYTLISTELNKFNPFNFKEVIKMETFTSLGRSTIRNSQVQSLIQICVYNLKRKIDNFSIFDIGMINDGIKTVAFATNEKSFDELKNNVLSLLNVEVIIERTQSKFFHNNVSAYIKFDNKIIGWIGKVHPQIINTTFFFAELFEEYVGTKNKKILFENYDKTSLKFRDITFSLEKHESVKSKLLKLKKISGIYNIKLIDQFFDDKENIQKSTFRIFVANKNLKKLDELLNA